MISDFYEARKFLHDIKEHRGSCTIYTALGDGCSQCPFEDNGCCRLYEVNEVLKKVGRPSCDDELHGTQQDCLKSLLRRIQKLENELQEKCISDRNGYNCLYEKCVANARSIDALKNDWNQVKEPFIDGNFTSLKVAVKAQYEELQRIKGHLYAIGRKGKE